MPTKGYAAYLDQKKSALLCDIIPPIWQQMLDNLKDEDLQQQKCPSAEEC